MTDLVDKGDLYLGIEIGGTKLQICVGDGAAKILERFRFKVDPATGAEGIRRQLEQTIPGLSRRIKPAAVGVGFGGPVDWTTGKICCSHQIEGWSKFPLADWLGSLARAPVKADNDANVAALAEATQGAGAGAKIVFYVTLGSGVGGGLIVNKKIFHGALPGESEIGHLCLDRSGTTLESHCAGWAVDARLRAAALEHPASILAQTIGSATSNEASYLAAALAQNDPHARRILDETAADLSFGLSHVVHLFHPDVIVLGGGLSLIGEPWRLKVEQSLRPHVMEAFAPGPSIALSELGEDVVPVGAITLALQER